ncbi:MAG: hypothetical protein AAF333_04390 [Planctomycetota bacterium]
MTELLQTDSVRVVLACTLLTTAICLWPAGSAAQDQQSIDQQIEQLEAARELTDQIEQELRTAAQQIEDEQRALLDRLNRTYDELQQEKQRNRELQRQLDGLLNEPVSPQDDAASPAQPASPTGVRWVPRVERRVDALGLVVPTRTVLADVPPGVNGLALTLSTGLSPDQTHPAARVMAAGTVVTLEHPFPTGDSLKLATLQVRDGQMSWHWHAFSPSRVHELLPQLDQQLRFAVIETQIDGVPIGRYQFTPDTLVLPHEPATAPTRIPLKLPKSTGARLTNPAAGPGWALLESSPIAVAWGGRDLSISVVYDGEALAVSRGPGVASKLEEIKRQRQLWESDVRQASTTGAPAVDAQRSVKHLQTLIDAEEQLSRALEEIGEVTGSTHTLSLELVGPQPTMTLYRVGFDATAP